MKILIDYLFWHYTTAVQKILKVWHNYLIFFYHYFSVDLLLSTLFHPWKREVIVKTRPGFSFDEWLTRFSFNFFSRIIGSCVRFGTIISWLFVEWAVILDGALLIPVWLLTPFLSFPLYWSTLPQVQIKKRQKAYQEFLAKRALDQEDPAPITQWFERNWQTAQKKARFWALENLLKTPGIGQDWAYGFTPHLDKYTQDLTQPKPYSHHLIGREKEVDQIEQVLSRAAENNVLLVGEPGVGKETIILGFAKKVKEGTVFPPLQRKRVLELNLTALLAELKDAHQAQDRLAQILKEASFAGNIILVIFDFDQYIASTGQRINLTSAFLPYLSSREIQIIAVTTPELFQKYIFKNEEILKLFEKIEVSAPTKEEALVISEEVLPQFEKRTGVIVSFKALSAIIERSAELITHIPFPEKAIDLLDEITIFAQRKGIKAVLPSHVDQFLTQKTKVPLGEISQTEKAKLADLEAMIHQKVIDQEQAVSGLAKALRRARLGLSEKARPIGSFLFLGPTGVGKTQTAKALAWAWFGDENRMIRIDMSEFQVKEDLARLIGDSQSGEPGILANKIRQSPFSVLLLDEIEKAHPKILNLFLQVLDEGYFTDAFGKRVSCQNLIIIATSNAGAEFIREKFTSPQNNNNNTDKSDRLSVCYETLRKELVDYVLKKKVFSPELINRFDGVVVFKPLTKENLEKIARLLLENLNQRLLKKGLILKITPQLVKKVAELGYAPAFGARPMRRVIQDTIESRLAQMLLEGGVKKGEAIELDPTLLSRA